MFFAIVYLWGRNSGMDVYNQFANFFIQLSFLFLYLCCFFGNATRTPFDYNLSYRIMKCKNKIQKRSDFIKNAVWQRLCRNGFSSRLQKRRLFLCFRMLLRFWFSTVCILMCAEHRLYYVFPNGILSLRYSRCRNGFRLLRQRVCKRSGSWTSAEIFQNNVCGSAVPCCPAPSALQITPRQSSPCRLRASHFAVPSGFARRSICYATGLPRRNLGFAEMKTGRRYETRTHDFYRVKVAL